MFDSGSLWNMDGQVSHMNGTKEEREQIELALSVWFGDFHSQMGPHDLKMKISARPNQTWWDRDENDYTVRMCRWKSWHCRKKLICVSSCLCVTCKKADLTFACLCFSQVAEISSRDEFIHSCSVQEMLGAVTCRKLAVAFSVPVWPDSEQ